MLKEQFDSLIEATRAACRRCYGERLKALALFGSVARGTMRFDSDIDLLLVVSPLPDGRMRRMDEFRAVDEAMAGKLARAQALGIHTSLSPVFKTPDELRQGSLLFLDMIDEARILHDPEGMLKAYFADLGARLRRLGAQRVQKAGGYYWLLKPDLKPGEDFSL